MKNPLKHMERSEVTIFDMFIKGAFLTVDTSVVEDINCDIELEKKRVKITGSESYGKTFTLLDKVTSFSTEKEFLNIMMEFDLIDKFAKYNHLSFL